MEAGQDISFPRSPVTLTLKNMKVTYMKVFCTLFSIVTYVVDIVLDILVAYRHFEDGEYLYFGLTMLFIGIPVIVMTVFTMFWYCGDEPSEHARASTLHWIIRIIFLLLLMAPVLRNAEALYYAVMSTRSEKKVRKENFGRRMAYENLDASMLRLFQAFVECAPQVILQLYIVGLKLPADVDDFNTTSKLQVASVFSSLVSVSFAVASYKANLRASLDYKNDFSCSVAVFPFLWRFCELTSRLLTLGLFASLHLMFLPILFSMHFLIMFMVTRILSAGFCGSGPGEVLYNLLLSYMYFFCFINPKDDSTRWSYIFYYCLNLMENSVLICVWYKENVRFSTFARPVFIVVLLSFGLGLLIMTFYYMLLHPTRGKIYGRPSPVKPDRTMEQIEHIAREFGLDEEIINRFRMERENIPTRNEADFFQNVPQSVNNEKSGTRQTHSQQVEDTEL